MKANTDKNHAQGGNETVKISRSRTEKRRRPATVAAVLTAGAFLAGQTVMAENDQNRVRQVGNIFVIAMENHNFTQPNPTSSPQQILGNPAAPYINSLITAGNSNATQVSYATHYFNPGTGVHPSEPNYVWAEAGTDFGVHTDADPAPASGNTFYNQTIHLTAQLDAAGISWKNYQEDVELSTSAIHSASGTNAPTNVFNGTTQYNYAVKHNPMAFFADTALRNVYPLAQFFSDLENNAVAQYTWITPNQFNDAHSALNGGFTYNGVLFTGDQASIAQGDNFLSLVVPQIQSTAAYKNNGVIVIWWDESEGGDDTNHTIPEIILSPLAKGGAYASSVALNHSSDIATLEEIFGLPALNNHIPLTETNNFGGFNNVSLVNDLSDLFKPGTIPAPLDVTVLPGSVITKHGQVFQDVFIKNNGTSAVTKPLFLV
jgi:hypothetical protein